MHVKMRSLIKGLLAWLLLLSFVSVLHAADNTRFTLKDGIIYDSQLGLEWVPAPDRPMNHYQAEEYVRNLSLAGGGWRLPTREELQSLYDRFRPGGADPMFHVSNKWVWTSELNGSSDAKRFNFYYGNVISYDRDLTNDFNRVLAVRSRR